MTNYEKIKQMSVEEMAVSSMPFFACPYGENYIDCTMANGTQADCIGCTKDWLLKEAE